MNKFTIPAKSDKELVSLASALVSGGFEATCAFFSKDTNSINMGIIEHPLSIKGNLGEIPFEILVSCGADISAAADVLVAFGFKSTQCTDTGNFKVFRKTPHIE